MNRLAFFFLLLILPGCQGDQLTGFLKPYADGENLVIPYYFPKGDVCVNGEFPMISEEPITGLTTEFLNVKSLSYKRDSVGTWRLNWHDMIFASSGNGHIIIPLDEFTSNINKQIYVQFEYIDCTKERVFTGSSVYIYSASLKI